MTGHRQRRVSDFIQEELAELLQREVHDPRLSGVSITGVKVSPDLTQAHIYFSVLGDETVVQETLVGLEHAAGFLRRELAGRLSMRRVPVLTFHYDKSLVVGARIERLLHQIEEEGKHEENEP